MYSRMKQTLYNYSVQTEILISLQLYKHLGGWRWGGYWSFTLYLPRFSGWSNSLLHMQYMAWTEMYRMRQWILFLDMFICIMQLCNDIEIILATSNHYIVNNLWRNLNGNTYLLHWNTIFNRKMNNTRKSL